MYPSKVDHLVFTVGSDFRGTVLLITTFLTPCVFQVLLCCFPMPADSPVFGLSDGSCHVCSVWRGQPSG